MSVRKFISCSALTCVALAALACAPADETADTQPAAESEAMPAGASAVTYDTDAVATNVVTAAANVREGDAVLISGSPRDLQLLEDLAVQVRRSGGFPLVTLTTDRMGRRMVVDVPEQYDTQEPELGLAMANLFDVMIALDSNDDPGLLADVSAERLATRAQAQAPVNRAMLENNVRFVNLGNGMYPNASNAEAFGIPQSQLATMFWAAVNTDPAELAAVGDRVKGALNAGSELHISAANGTDLTVQIAGRQVLVSDGAISMQDEQTGGAATSVWLPAGEAFLTPVPGSANGTIVLDPFEFQGTAVEGLTLTIENGQLTGMTASAGLDVVQAAYDAAGEGKGSVGVIDFGLNPNVSVPEGSRFRSWVASGTVSLGIGNDTWGGGSNEVTYGLYGQIIGATVTVDGTTLIDAGRIAQ